MNLRHSLRYCLITLISLIFFYTIISYAEDESVKDCVNNFDINKVDFRRTDAAQYSYLLLEYVLCRAAATDNLNECYKLINPGECLRAFNMYWAYYGRLIAQGRITAKIISACKSGESDKEKTESGCDILSRVILDEDASVCGNIKNEFQRDYCKAVATKNTNFCRDSECKNTVFYLQSLKNSDVKLCDKISKTGLQWICKGGASADERICEQNKDFKEFVTNYCEQK